MNTIDVRKRFSKFDVWFLVHGNWDYDWKIFSISLFSFSEKSVELFGIEIYKFRLSLSIYKKNRLA